MAGPICGMPDDSRDQPKPSRALAAASAEPAGPLCSASHSHARHSWADSDAAASDRNKALTLDKFMTDRRRNRTGVARPTIAVRPLSAM